MAGEENKQSFCLRHVWQVGGVYPKIRLTKLLNNLKGGSINGWKYSLNGQGHQSKLNLLITGGENMDKKKIDIFEKMAERWPSSLVARTKIAEFSGGMVSCKTMANLDCQGVGPGRVKIGRRTGYPVDSLVSWLRARSDVNGDQNYAR